MDISVIVCTYNRERVLRRALDQMRLMHVPHDVTWELLVVDNGSTDGTGHVLDAVADRLPLRVLHEARPGKSFALNRALVQARGDYLIFTDDDVLVDSNWLAAYAVAFQRWPTDAVFGGPIVARWDGTPPHWLTVTRDVLGGVYAERDFGTQTIALSSERVPFGANMAIRAVDHADYRYPTALGPGRGDMVRGEDTAVARAMFARGYSGRWVPDACVEHVISAERQTLRYVRRYFVGHGRQLAVEPHKGPMLFGRPRWVWRSVLETSIRYAVARVRNDPTRWMRDLIAASVAWGRLRGPRRVRVDVVRRPPEGIDSPPEP